MNTFPFKGFGIEELVIVTNFKSIDEIFVQQVWKVDELVRLEKDLRLCGQSSKFLYECHPKVEHMYNVFSLTLRKWVRGKVLRVDSKEMLVDFVDYRLESNVPIKGNVKRLNECQKSFAAMVTKVSPIGDGSPPYEKFIRALIRGSNFKVIVIPKEIDDNQCYKVEFFIPSNCLVRNDTNVSFRDIYENKKGIHVGQDFMELNSSTYDGFIVHVEEENHSVVTKLNIAGFLDFQKKLENFYTNNRRDLSLNRVWPICLGMPVVAYVENGYHRARISSFISTRSPIEVLLIDTGLKKMVFWTNLYKIIADFYQFSETIVNWFLLEDVETKAPELKHKKVNIAIKMKLGSGQYKATVLDNSSNVVLGRNVSQNMTRKEVEEEEKEKVSSDINVQESKEQPFVIEENVMAGKTKVIVTNVVSPSEVYVRTIKMQEALDVLEKRLASEFKVCKKLFEIQKEDVQPSGHIAVRIGNRYKRGIVTQLIHGDNCVVYIMDDGITMNVSSHTLKRLPSFLMDKNALCLCISLEGIVPAGGNNANKWTKTAEEKLREICKPEDILYAQIVSIPQGSRNESKMRGVLYRKVELRQDVFSSLETRLDSIGDLLVHHGVALKVNNLQKYDFEDLFNIEVGCMSTSSSEVLLREITWLPPELPKRSNFYATLTHIDYNGHFYLQVSEWTCKQMNKILSKTYEKRNNSLPIFQGDMVVAKYPVKSLGWFRGIVTHVYQDQTADIFFIDYGDCQRVQRYNKDVHFDEVPIQSIRCILDGIGPVKDDGYDKEFINEMNGLLVDRIMEVTILKESDSFPVRVKLSFKNMDVAHYFLSRKEARKIENGYNATQSMVINIQPNSNQSYGFGASQYEIEEGLKTCGHIKTFHDFFQHEPFPVELVSIVNDNFIHVKPKYGYYESTNSTAINTMIYSLYESYEKMNMEINNIAEMSRPVVQVKKGLAVLAKSCDQNWHRAYVTCDPDLERVKIFKMDKGSYEQVTCRKIHKMPIGFCSLPPMIIQLHVKQDVKKLQLDILKVQYEVQNNETIAHLC